MKKSLETALKDARKRRGWSIYQAANRLGFSSTNMLRTLEGLNPDREPGGESCRLSTVLRIIEIYWPDVELEDFCEYESLFKITAKDPTSLRVLKGFYDKTG